MGRGYCTHCGAPLPPDLDEVDAAAAVAAATAGPVLVPGELPPLDAPPAAAAG